MENKRKRFEKYRDIRMMKLKSVLKSIGHMANKKHYDYDSNDKKEITKHIQQWSREAIRSFEKASSKSRDKDDWRDA